MEPWAWALLLKPMAFVLLAVAYYFTVVKGVRALERLFPAGRLKDFLFRERGRPEAGTASTPPLQALLHGETSAGSDRPRDTP